MWKKIYRSYFGGKSDVLLTKLYKNLEVYHEAEEIILSILVKEEKIL